MERGEKCSLGPGDRAPILDSVGGHCQVGSIGAGKSHAKTIQSLLPQTWLEIVLWIALSASAGVCEEIVYRGYLQKQFQAITGSIALAVFLQALVFGAGHAYQGMKQVVVISVLGALYGVRAAWRKNLRPWMIAPTLSDIVGGLLGK